MYVLKEGYACEDLKTSAKDFQKDLAKLCATGLVKYDAQVQVVLIKNFLRHNPITNPNQTKAAKKTLLELPKTPILKDFKALNEGLCEGLNNGLWEVNPKLTTTTTTDTTTDSEEDTTKSKDIDIFSEHLLNVLKISLSDKKQTEGLLKLYGLEKMLAAVNRMRFYFDMVKKNKWTEYVISKYWRNLYEKIDYFISDENFDIKMAATAKSNKGKGLKLQESPWEKIHKYDADGDDNIDPPEIEKERLRNSISEYKSEINDVSPEGMIRLENWRKRLAILEKSK